jgi:hypothetical protein
MLLCHPGPCLPLRSPSSRCCCLCQPYTPSYATHRHPQPLACFSVCRPLLGCCSHSCMLLCHPGVLPAVAATIVALLPSAPNACYHLTQPVRPLHCVTYVQAPPRLLQPLLHAAVPPWALPTLPPAGGRLLLLWQGSHEAAMRQQRVLMQVGYCLQSTATVICYWWL